MNRFISILAAFVALIVTSCEKVDNTSEANVDATSGASKPSGNNENGGQGVSDGKSLIIVFSRAGENWQVGIVDKGNTMVMAEYIQEATGADLFEIVPENAYPQSYSDMLTVATNEKNAGARPKFKGAVDNLEQYVNVFIGGPIWWGEPPMILHTFCETYPALGGKTLIPFGTHGGSGIGSYSTLLKSYYPDAKYLESLGISGASVREATSKTAVQDWVRKLGLEKKTQQ